MIVRFVVDFLGFALWIVLSSAFLLLLLRAWDVLVLSQPWRRHRWLSAWRTRRRVAYERYAAERFIRDTRQQAISELLAIDREVRGDVIESTAVEVKR